MHHALKEASQIWEFSSLVKIHVFLGFPSDFDTSRGCIVFGTVKTVHNLFRPIGDVICKNINSTGTHGLLALLQQSHDSSKTSA